MADKEKMPADQSQGGVHLHRTKNNQNAKAVSVALLQARVADGIDMALITKQAHWNLKGPQFIGVHLMLDTFREQQDEFVDTMAERIVQLGGTAFGTAQEVDKRTKLAPYPIDIYQVSDHVHALIDRYAEVANAIRANIDEVDEAGDAGHRRHLHRGVARHRQAVVVSRGAYPGAVGQRDVHHGQVGLRPTLPRA